MFSFREVNKQQRCNWTNTASLMAAVVSHWKQSTWNLLTHFHHINGWLACRVALSLRCQDTGVDVDCGELRSGPVTRQLDHRGLIKNLKEMLCFCCSIGFNLNKSLTFFVWLMGNYIFKWTNVISTLFSSLSTGSSENKKTSHHTSNDIHCNTTNSGIFFHSRANIHFILWMKRTTSNF